MTNQNELLGKLSEELGFDDLPEDKKQQLLIKMTEVILKRVFIETMQRLSETDQASYEKMIEENSSPEEVENFLRGKIAGYDSLVKKVVEDFEKEMKKI
jgi:hypothetical protein